MSAESVGKALDKHGRELMSIPGVVGTGQGQCGGKPCIKVFVTKKTPELEKKVACVLGDIPAEIVESGEISPLDKGRQK